MGLRKEERSDLWLEPLRFIEAFIDPLMIVYGAPVLGKEEILVARNHHRYEFMLIVRQFVRETRSGATVKRRV